MRQVGRIGFGFLLLAPTITEAQVAPQRDENPRRDATVMADRELARANAIKAEEQAIARARAARLRAPVSLRFVDDPQPITIESRDPAESAGGEEEEVAPPKAPAARRIDLNSAVLDRKNFDRWVFGDYHTHELRLKHLKMVQDWEMDKIEKDREMNDAVAGQAGTSGPWRHQAILRPG